MHMLPADFIKQADFALPLEEHSLFLEALEGSPTVSIRLNPYKPSSTNHFKNLPTVGWEQEGHYLPKRISFTTDVDFWAGCYYVQEASSMFVGEVLRQTLPLSEALVVLDLCAAPGGKSTHIASLLSAESILVSNEIVRQRAQILGENMCRFGQGNFILTNQNSAQIGQLTGIFDAVIVDAPCSGEGMFRKDREARNEWSVANVRTCVARQQEIIANISPTIKEDGLLIYSTCTFNTQENEQNLLPLLEEGWESIPLQIPAEWHIVKNETTHDGQILYGYRFYPHLLQGEGFFISCLRKKYSEKSPRKIHFKNPHLMPIASKKQDFLKDWVTDLTAYKLYQTAKNDVFALPAHQADNMQQLGEILHAWSTGYHIGTRKHDDLEPAPAWALANTTHGNVLSIDLPAEDALDFLRKKDIKTPVPAQKGWYLATYNGLGLGWLKALPNRWNNYYPAPWRIRNL